MHWLEAIKIINEFWQQWGTRSAPADAGSRSVLVNAAKVAQWMKEDLQACVAGKRTVSKDYIRQLRADMVLLGKARVCLQEDAAHDNG